MRIQTEILRTILVVTCLEPRLDASVAQSFFHSVQGCIHKGHRQIAIDLSKIDFIDSTGLGALVRCLKELSKGGQLVLFGVNDTVLSLLQMTRLDTIFTQVEGKRNAIELLLFNKKQFTCKASDECDIGEVVSLEMDDGYDIIDEVSSDERRKYQRIKSKKILDEDIIVYCTNSKTGKRSTGVILNFSPGGLLLISHSKFKIGDEFTITGMLGKNFKLKELAVVRQIFDGKYGNEFIEPSTETIKFLHQLTSSVTLRQR